MEDDRNYIKPATAWQKLKVSWSLMQPVYIYGVTGYGKTELIRHYLSGRQYLYYSCPDNLWEQLPEQKKSQKTVVVVDDIQYLVDEQKRQDVLTLTEREDVWLILAGRCQLPSWLFPQHISYGFTIIKEDDLKLQEPEVKDFLKKIGVNLTEAEFREFCRFSDGNAYAVRCSALYFQEGMHLGEEMIRKMVGACKEFLEKRVMEQMDNELLEFLMQVSVVDEFTVELAELIVGSSSVPVLLEKARETGNFLFQRDHVYSIHSLFIPVLRNRALRVYGTEKMKELAYNAGLYYETRDQIVPALRMFEQSGHKDRIRELLIRNARRNAGNGHYYELRRYYLELEEADICGSPVLMAGISMLYSLLMEPEKSEGWYRRLKEYAGRVKGGDKREAQSRLFYLDIALPHRGSRDILDILKSIPTLLFNKGIGLPEFSVTSNLPSTMNGGKDFCHWVPMDRMLASSIGKLVEQVLGRMGKGIVNVALGESLYEKGADISEVMALLTCGEMEAGQGGTLEIGFVAVGLRVRLVLLCGDLRTARDILSSFEIKVKTCGAKQLLPNLEALKCRLGLFGNNREEVEQWMETAPDEDKEFFILERYRYLTKVRCYIAFGAHLKALALLEKLRYYAVRYQRTYIQTEVGMLAAVVKFRCGDDWKTEFLTALKGAQQYKFIRIICEEGAAVNELLRLVKKDLLAEEGTDKVWLSCLLEETDKMARRYPMYLNTGHVDASKFSETALAILRLQGDNLTVGEIGRRLNLDVENVRYHIKQNYKKLGVSGKAAAVLAARNLGIL